MSQQSSSVNEGRASGAPVRRISGRQMEALIRSAAFGEIVSILMRAPRYRNLSLGALRAQVLPAVANNQYFIGRVRRQGGDGAVAAGLAIWASVSDEVDRRLRADPKPPLKLAPAEWKSGPNLWLIDLVAPSVLAGSILRDLDAKIAKGRPMLAQIAVAGGGAAITTVKDLLAGLDKPKS
jgi:cytolysin-activating lysine-acyltransferase